MRQSIWKRSLELYVPLKRPYRRALVLAFHGGYVALLAFLPHLPVPWLQAAYVALLVCWLLIYITTGFLADERTSTLDERQTGIRNLAHRYAYLLLVGVAVIVSGLASERDVGTLAMYALLTYAVLPGSVIAWLEPNSVVEVASATD